MNPKYPKSPLEPEPRSIALDVLIRVESRRVTLDRLLEDALEAHDNLSRRDKSFLMAMVWGVLRWRGRLDWIIAQFSKTPLKKIDPPVLNILRIGLFQIIQMDRVPASAAVNTSVELAKKISRPHVVKYVNAVLRRAAREHASLTFPDGRRDPVSALVVRCAMPPWLAKRWVDRYGVKEARWLCDTVNTIPPLTLRTNTLNTGRGDLISEMGASSGRIEPTSHSPLGIRVYGLKQPLETLAAFKKGSFQVQDEAAQLVTLLLGPRPGEWILDACAGLGGKTGHIAQQMENQGLVLALDHRGGKLERLQGEMVRLGISIVNTRAHDLNRSLPHDFENRYDRVLLDAPCSGLGVLRRNPDAKWSTQPQQLLANQERQIRFLSRLAPLVRPGGFLVYAVCSLEPEETGQVRDAFLMSHPQFAPQSPDNLFQDSGLIDSEGCFRTLPHRHDMDGFFAVRFQRTG